MRRRLNGRLSYANVASTLALVAALATGGAYAAAKIDGSDIAKNSIPGNRVQKATSVPRAKVADQVEQLLVGGVTPKRRADGRAVAAGAGDEPSPVVRLSAGDDVMLFEKGPLAFRARCVDEGGGSYRVEEYVTSSEAGWLSGQGHLTSHGAGDQEVLFSFSAGPGAQFNAGQRLGNWVVMTPSGTSLTTGSIWGGVNLLGSHCLVSTYAVG